jgi:hypothetical protein
MCGEAKDSTVKFGDAKLKKGVIIVNIAEERCLS